MDSSIIRRWLIATFALAITQACSAASAAGDARLVGPEWVWQPTSDARAVDRSRYAIRFSSDGTLRVRADCNRGSGRYSVDGTRLSLSRIATTKKGCGADSKDREFLRSLSDVVSYRVDDDVLVLRLGSGKRMQFRENG